MSMNKVTRRSGSSVKLGFDFNDKNIAVSSITVEDLNIIEHEVKVLEDLSISKSKQLKDHVSMLESVSSSIASMEAQLLAKEEEEIRLLEEKAIKLEESATVLSNKVIEIDDEVAQTEQELIVKMEVQLELKLLIDNEFASWYNVNSDYFNSQTVYTQANILQSELSAVVKKQEASNRLKEELSLKDNVTSLLADIQESSPNVIKIDNCYDKLEELREKALNLGLYSSKQPGEIVKALKSVESELWKLEREEVKEEIEALILSIEFEESVDKDKIKDFREEIKGLQEAAKEYNLYKDLLYAWQVLDNNKPKELQEAENARHARRLALSEEQKSNSVIAHALSEAQAR